MPSGRSLPSSDARLRRLDGVRLPCGNGNRYWRHFERRGCSLNDQRTGITRARALGTRSTSHGVRLTCVSVIPMHLRSMSDDLTALSDHGLVVEPGPFARLQDAWSAARVLVDKAAATNARLAGRGRLCDP